MPSRALIRTARLTLRPLDASDEAALIAGVSPWPVMRWLAVVPHPYGPEEFRDFLAYARPGREWAITDRDGFAGMISMDREFGYWLAPRAQGRGYATEASRAVLAFHFADRLAGPVRSGHFDGNAASRNVLVKLGFSPDGFKRIHPVARPMEKVLSHRMQLTREDWLAADPLRIETDRLILQPLDAERDTGALARIGGDPRVAAMMTSLRAPWPEDDIRQWIAASRWQGSPGFRLGVFNKNGQLLGTVGYGGSPVSVAYFIDPGFWGQGLATEAMRGFLNWITDRFAPPRIEAEHFSDNPASGRVLQKLGAVRAGIRSGHSGARATPMPTELWLFTPDPASPSV